MSISARLSPELEKALTRFCKTNGITKTEAIEKGIGLLLEQDREREHPAFAAYRQLKLVPEAAASAERSSDHMRAAIRAKYPG